MKKQYIAPLTEVVKVNAERVVCSSPDGYEKAMGSAPKSGAQALSKDDYEDYDEDLW